MGRIGWPVFSNTRCHRSVWPQNSNCTFIFSRLCLSTSMFVSPRITPSPSTWLLFRYRWCLEERPVRVTRGETSSEDFNRWKPSQAKVGRHYPQFLLFFFCCHLILDHLKQSLDHQPSINRFPFILCTNGGGVLESSRCQKLTEELGVPVSDPDLKLWWETIIIMNWQKISILDGQDCFRSLPSYLSNHTPSSTSLFHCIMTNPSWWLVAQVIDVARLQKSTSWSLTHLLE